MISCSAQGPISRPADGRARRGHVRDRPRRGAAVGPQSFGLRTPFDSCTTVLLGAVLSRAVVGTSDFWPTVAGAAGLVLMHRLTGGASVRWPWIEQLVDGRERELVRAGQVDETELRKALVTRHDLREALRRRTGDDDLARVDKVILEPNGEITVLVKS